jgi:hypothetical protein
MRVKPAFLLTAIAFGLLTGQIASAATVDCSEEEDSVNAAESELHHAKVVYDCCLGMNNGTNDCSRESWDLRDAQRKFDNAKMDLPWECE